MNLATCIRQIESSDNEHATRFESSLFEATPSWIESQLAKIAKANACNTATALQMGCTSYGLFQLLGANIYDLGYSRDIVSFMTDPRDVAGVPGGGVQNIYFDRFINPQGFISMEELAGWKDERFLAFARFYNGPGDPAAYANAMKEKAGLGPLAA